MSPFEIIAGLIGIGGSAWGAYLAYRRGNRADKTAEQHAATVQVYAGIGGVIQGLQDDNAELRRVVTDLRERLAAAEDHIASLLEKLGG